MRRPTGSRSGARAYALGPAASVDALEPLPLAEPCPRLALSAARDHPTVTLARARAVGAEDAADVRRAVAALASRSYAAAGRAAGLAAVPF